MSQPPGPAKPASANNPAAGVLPIVLLVSAALLAALGTILPGMMEFTGPERWLMSGVFYVAAAGDVVIALWLRSRTRKARASESSGGTVQRQ